MSIVVMANNLTTAERRSIDELVEYYLTKRQQIAEFQKQVFDLLMESPDLATLAHSIRQRTKDPEHLRDKLERKLKEAKKKGKKFVVSKKNLLTKINDLAGIRVLHLYTRQIGKIDKVLKSIFAEYRLE